QADEVSPSKYLEVVHEDSRLECQVTRSVSFFDMCAALRSTDLLPEALAVGSGTDDVRASLDFLDRVIEEYNSLPESVAEQTSLTPEGDDDPSSLNGNEVGDSAAEALEAPEHFSINLVIVNEVVKEEEQPIAGDPAPEPPPPPVPKRLPPLPRSSSAGCMTSREYPVSPPPRRRYLSPERRRRALQLNNGNKAPNGSVANGNIVNGHIASGNIVNGNAAGSNGIRDFRRSPATLQDARDSFLKELSFQKAPQSFTTGSVDNRLSDISKVCFEDQEPSDEEDPLFKKTSDLLQDRDAFSKHGQQSALQSVQDSQFRKGHTVRNGNGCHHEDEDDGSGNSSDNLKMTVTFRTVPEMGSFRRKSESRNSIHVDFSVRDGHSCNGRGGGGTVTTSGENGTGNIQSSGLSRSRSLRGQRNHHEDISNCDRPRRTWEDFSPPPLPPRKAKEDVNRKPQFSSSPTTKRVTFQIVSPLEPPAVQEPPQLKDADTTPEDTFFTRPHRSASVGKSTKLNPAIRNGSSSPPSYGGLGTNGRIDSKDANKECKTKDSGINRRTQLGQLDKDHVVKSSSFSVMSKTFEPPSSVSDVSTDCYNVYNVRTRKISSSVTKPDVLGGRARSPLETVQTSNGSGVVIHREGQFSKLRNMSPTREAEKLIGKIISRCKSGSALGNKERKAAVEARPSQPQQQQQPLRTLKLTPRQQQRHSRCTKCALAQSK
ncbi:hypothetical protein HPB47_003999, partial [Ixodes persulcatus]